MTDDKMTDDSLQDEESATVLANVQPEDIEIKTIDWNFYYREKQALFDINMDILSRRVTALIGPSGCGKSTLLRCFNRINDLVDGVSMKGKIMFNGSNIYDKSVDVSDLRTNIGMVFQKPNPFPKTIFENVAYGLRIQGIKNKREINDRVELAIKDSGLWGEVSSRLNENALGLSGGQQQRLVIARSIAIQPKVLLLDEPTSALDPISTAAIEELIFKLKTKYTIIIVTHNMQQAARVSDFTAFMYLGKLIEYSNNADFFTSPKKKQTEDYITGRFG